jgi:hypothetical protein
MVTMSRWGAKVRRAAETIMDLLEFRRLRVHSMGLNAFKEDVLAGPGFRPVFFLSTGRTGTAFFTELINRQKGLHAWHAPEPQLIQQGRIAYEHYAAHLHGSGADRHLLDTLLGQVVLAARERLLHGAYTHGVTYVETNNRMTFFAPAIRAVMPGSRFVHLHRHPGEFVRSGMRREWYVARSEHEAGRLRPHPQDPHYRRWPSYSQLEKIAWLWVATNEFIEWACEDLVEHDAVIRASFGEDVAGTAAAVMRFLGVEVGSSVLGAAGRVVNAQRTGSFPPYREWPKEAKEQLRAICGPLAERYRYEL